MQRRERFFLTAGVLAAVLIVLWRVSLGPLDTYRNSAQKRDAAQLRLEQARLWHEEIDTAQKKVEAIRQKIIAQGATFDLWTHIDSVVKLMALGPRADIRSRRGVSSPTDKVSAVELQLNGVNLQELVDLVHKIYDNDFIIILDRVDHIKPAQTGNGLDCRMVFLAPKL
jgi:hypothetical protein